MRDVLLSVATVMAMVASASGVFQATAPRPAAAPYTVESSQAFLDQYCVTCHSAQLRTAELALDTIDLGDVGTTAAVWEKVVRKLRTGAMPPPGRPRPDEAVYDSVASWLETELDRAAAASPDPGRSPALHRLSRTEYQNAILDLLAFEHLPKEMDVALLLPADNAASGFDNLAELLFVSPALMERYLSAARKISRLAVGDPTIRPIVDTYRFPRELPQDVHVEGLPFGTRGGALITTHLPLDGDYVVTIEFAGRAYDPHQLEVSVDGERVKLFTVGDKPPGPRGPGVTIPQPDDDVEIRLRLKAGPRQIAVAFLKKTSAPSEGLVRRNSRGRGGQPALASITISGPYDGVGAGDTPSRARIFVCRPDGLAQADAEDCAREILSTLARRAYRRPVTDADLDLLLPFYRDAQAERGFDGGIQYALQRLLVSPEFLFRIERDPATVAANSVYRISDLELASRLSFLLWSSIPDDELLNAAVRGDLSHPARLEQQVRRMLTDSRSRALVNNFAEQWLYLRDVQAKRPDTAFFPNFDEGLRQAFQKETELFIDSIMREDRSVLDLLTADHTFVNERLAKHYGIPHVYGSHFRRITAPGARRGLLGQGSVLTLTSYATRTSPVLRGKWILDNILSAPPPPPPPNVPALEDTNTEGEVLSMRDRMVQHRKNPVCASCHAQMDPLGLALENFDAVGRWRTHGESNSPIDASGVLPNGVAFDGPAGLRQALLHDPALFATTVTEKLLTYALGRELGYYDAPAIRAITRDAARSDYSFSSLMLGIVNSTPFQMRRSPS